MSSPDTALLPDVSLDDKYTLDQGRVYLSGVQALVRLPLVQRRRDQAQGLNTAGLISGYRGSPLGGYDSALWQARSLLAAHHIRFEPGVNEELAVTAVWGSQQTEIFGGARYDGVFGLWYAKNPGVDRAGDALKHANAAGTAPRGGALAVVGDDPGASSSTMPNQCEPSFIAAMIPVIFPAAVDEFVDFGLWGFAASRLSGLWTAFKTVSDTVESSLSMPLRGLGEGFRPPADWQPPAGGVHGRWPDDRWSQDARLQTVKLPGLMAFARANPLDRVSLGAPGARLGIVAAGKSWLDVGEALALLGIDQALAVEIGLAVYKVGLVWPLDGEGLGRFAAGLEELLVVEELRPVLEPQIMTLAYHWSAARRPRVVGKTDEGGAPLFPVIGELSPPVVARAIAARLRRLGPLHPRIAERLARLEAERTRPPVAATVARIPHFCAGCPHARSTQLPDGSAALAGIGCHSLAMWMDGRRTSILTQMGGEGVTWVGLAPFVDTPHMFQNLGDGTYYHSGILAIRQALSAGTRITYKILINDAAAMTGGQPVEGAITAAKVTGQLQAEGVGRIAVVTDDLARHAGGAGFAAGVTLHPRQDMDRLQRELRDWPGVSAIVWDQVCATEKRRRRKRGIMAPPALRPFINTLVCEGCGDCTQVSGGCVGVQPVDTPFGRKRAIDQSVCNIDLGCVEGLCPSFVTVEGGRPRRPSPTAAAAIAVPPPTPLPLGDQLDILVAGVGGTGVITVGALIGMAAHLEGRGCSVLDNTGLARKGGAVTTHVRLGAAGTVAAPRIAAGGADVVIGCDLVVTAGAESLSKMAAGRSRVVLNTHPTPTAPQLADPDARLDAAALSATIGAAAGLDAVDGIDAAALAQALVGDGIYANVLLLGYAFQKGLIPLSAAALDQAMEINGTAVDGNRAAFAWGRRAAHDPAAVAAAIAPAAGPEIADDGLDAVVARRTAFLADYQDAAYARRYGAVVARMRTAEARRLGAEGAVSDAVARALFKLMAYKDEYEVARLLTAESFRDEIDRNFEGDWRIAYHLAPPLLTGRQGDRPRKRRYGPWLRPLLKGLAGLRRLRGGWADPFGHTAERRRERAAIAAYETLVDRVAARLTADTQALAAELLALPLAVRGFGAVKARAAGAAETRQAELLARLDGTSA